MPLFRHLVFTAFAIGGLTACATTVATPPHPLLTARQAVPVVHPADSSQQRQARQLLVRGMTHARIGDHERALEFYQQALEAAPAMPAVLSAVAAGYEALGDVPSALLYAERAARLAPERIAYWAHWADLLRRDGQPEAAGEVVDELLARASDDPEALRVALDHYLAREQHDDAVRLAARLAESGSAQLPWQQLLPLLEAERQPVLFEAALVHALEADPGAPGPYAELGRFYLQAGRPAEALAVLESGRLYTPGSPALTDLLGEARRATGSGEATATPATRVAEARRLLDEAPSAAARERARDLLDAALATEPDRVEALVLAGRLAYETSDYGMAAAHLTRALERNPREVDLWALTAQAQLANGAPAAALETLEEALLLFPAQPDLLLARGAAHLALGQAERAHADAQRALDRLGESAPAETLARARELLAQAAAARDAP